MGIPLPPTDLLISIIDVLGKRYGWSFREVTEDMYWEDIYQMYEYSSNMETLENNEQMKFNYLLHAQTKDALNKWQDVPVPYPDRTWQPQTSRQQDDPNKLSGFRELVKTEKATPEQRKRFSEVSARLANHRLEIARGNYTYDKTPLTEREKEIIKKVKLKY